jgi:hypothetical protein
LTVLRYFSIESPEMLELSNRYAIHATTACLPTVSQSYPSKPQNSTKSPCAPLKALTRESEYHSAISFAPFSRQLGSPFLGAGCARAAVQSWLLASLAQQPAVSPCEGDRARGEGSQSGSPLFALPSRFRRHVAFRRCWYQFCLGQHGTTSDRETRLARPSEAPTEETPEGDAGAPVAPNRASGRAPSPQPTSAPAFLSASGGSRLPSVSSTARLAYRLSADGRRHISRARPCRLHSRCSLHNSAMIAGDMEIHLFTTNITTILSVYSFMTSFLRWLQRFTKSCRANRTVATSNTVTSSVILSFH